MMLSDLNYEDVTLIWLDSDIETDADCLDTKCHLHTIVNYLKVFDDAQKAIDYIKSAVNEHVFLIVSGSLGHSVLPEMIDVCQLKVIYVFCLDESKHAELASKYEKVAGVFVDKHQLFQHLASRVRAYEKSLSVMSIFKRKDVSIEETSTRGFLAEERVTLMWVRSFCEIMLHVPLDKDLAKQDMISECRSYYRDSPSNLKKIELFETYYAEDLAIYWYTLDSFVYRLVNRALRTRDIDIIFRFRFFIVDLYQQLKQHHTKYIQSLSPVDTTTTRIRTLYRTQLLGDGEAETLQDSVGGYVCPNSFFSTSEDLERTKFFGSGSSASNSVIFQIDIPDSYYENIGKSLAYSHPFYKLDDVSQFEDEKEIIFSLGTLFRVVSVEKRPYLHVQLQFEGDYDDQYDMRPTDEELENKRYDWQSRREVDDRILLLAEQLPDSCRSPVIYYIKYCYFHDENYVIGDETLSTYRKGFDLLIKCLPDYHHLLTVTMYLGMGSLYRGNGQHALARQFGETALQLAETHLNHCSDSVLVCYNYLAVLHLLVDQYKEALLIYEKMLTIAAERNNDSASLAVYQAIIFLKDMNDDAQYAFVCCKKIAELKRKLGCEDVAKTYFHFGSAYKNLGNFRMAVHCFKQHFCCLMQRNAPVDRLIQAYSLVADAYGDQQHYIAAAQAHLRLLQAAIASLPDHDRLILDKYDAVIRSLERLLKCANVKKLRRCCRSIISKSPVSATFKQYVREIRFLFYFEFNHSTAFRASLKQLLDRVLRERSHRCDYEEALKDFQSMSRRFLEVKSACFARIYRHGQFLNHMDFVVRDYYQWLFRVQRSHFSNFYFNAKRNSADFKLIKSIATNVEERMSRFVHSSHATQCNDKVIRMARLPHRSPWMYRYRYCGCVKTSVAVLKKRSTKRWVKFSAV